MPASFLTIFSHRWMTSVSANAPDASSLADESTVTYVAEHPHRRHCRVLERRSRSRMDDMPYTWRTVCRLPPRAQYQRQGIGRRLVGELCAWLLSQGSHLHVHMGPGR